MPNNQKLRLAVAQSIGYQEPTSQQIRRGGAHIRELMQQAHDAKATLLHFPEGAISGYPSKRFMSVTSPEVGPSDWSRADWVALREELESTARLAQELTLWVALGSIHPLISPHRPHNSLYIISSEGRVVTRYDKRLLSYTELSYMYTPGLSPVVFEVDGFRFGCALCIEVNFPEVFMEYERLGVDCVLFSSYSEDAMFGVIAQGHAAANSYWLSFSVPAQYSHAAPSGVIAPSGHWLAQGKRDGQPEVIVVDLERGAKEAEEAFKYKRPWRKTARSGIYNEHLVVDERSANKTSF